MLLHSSSPLSFTYSTPSRSSYYSARSYQPVNSSPLASPIHSSPTHDAQQRRRAQYKSKTPTSSRSSANKTSAQLLLRNGNQTPEDPQKAFLRERFQARCRAHAQDLRKHAVNSRRSSDAYSDVFMDGDDDEESDDVIMGDELFQRIMQNAKNKKMHSYRVSYALEVGSSFDPDMEDPSAWENELRDKSSSSLEPTPDEWEEELLHYAEKQAAFADFVDLDLDGDFDDFPPTMPLQTRPSRNTHPTSDMDVS